MTLTLVLKTADGDGCLRAPHSRSRLRFSEAVSLLPQARISSMSGRNHKPAGFPAVLSISAAVRYHEVMNVAGSLCGRVDRLVQRRIKPKPEGVAHRGILAIMQWKGCRVGVPRFYLPRWPPHKGQHLAVPVRSSPISLDSGPIAAQSEVPGSNRPSPIGASQSCPAPSLRPC